MTEDDPFEDLGPEDDDADVDAAIDDLFTEVQVDEFDDEAVWDALTEGDAAAGGPGGNGAGQARAVDEAAPPDEREGTVVPKASYCQKCEHFSKPPQAVCGNPGTEIVELVDVDHFRVRNCPVVERRESASRDIGDEE